MENEFLLIKKFVIVERQDRYLNLITTKKGRIKFRKYISHFSDLNTSYCTALNHLKSSKQLYDILVSKGASEGCYIISENSKYDMIYLPLWKAIQILYGSGMGFFLSCAPGRLLYYEGEENNQRFLIEAN